MTDCAETDSRDTGEYEDDFEKDLEWLINDPSEASDADVEGRLAYENEQAAPRDSENAPDPADASPQPSNPATPPKEDTPARRNDFISVPSIQPLDPVSDSDSENSSQESRLEARRELDEDEDEEVRRYIMEKIVAANRLLQSQGPVSERRGRKLKFKDKLVDLEVPPLEDTEAGQAPSEGEGHVSGQLSRLSLSGEEQDPEKVPLSLPDGPEESRDGKVLVERDGKFELLNFQDIESQALPPSASPAPAEDGDPPQATCPPASPPGSEPGKEDAAVSTQDPVLQPPEEPQAHTPKQQVTPSPRLRPASTASSEPSQGARRAPPRSQSAYLPAASSTYCLSPQQKELQRRLEQKRTRLRQEEEQKKLEQEKEKKKENELVFKAWLQRKREQVLEMRRVQRAKQMEELHGRVSPAAGPKGPPPHEAHTALLDISLRRRGPLPPVPAVLRGHSQPCSGDSSPSGSPPRRVSVPRFLGNAAKRVWCTQQENRDPQQAFRLWLKKKHEEQLRERRTEEMRKQEECLYFLKGTEGRERAFRQWLRRKELEKLAEQQMAKERTRQLRQEARRLKQRQSAHMFEAKAFRFTDPYK